jgi:hypothetical protein
LSFRIIARFYPPDLKYEEMKLSKSLLSAILIGIAVQTLPACKKEKQTPKTSTENTGTARHPTPAPCPNCGMG